MKEFNEVLDIYLKKPETDYAIMLNGAWGCGKTYYAKGELAKKISSKYELVYISLSGIRSTEGIKEQIYRKISPIVYNFNNSKITKAAKSTASNLIKTKLGVVVENLQLEFNISKEIKIGNYFFIIDDFERIDTHFISLKSVLGYIGRSLIEEKQKVIIVGDISKFSTVDKSTLAEIKEKFIRWSFEYSPSMCTLINSIIDSHYKRDSEYQNFLKSNSVLILRYINDLHLKNLRTIQFVFDVYLRIWNNIKKVNESCSLPILNITFIIAHIKKKGIYLVNGTLPEYITRGYSNDPNRILFDYLGDGYSDKNIEVDPMEKEFYGNFLKRVKGFYYHPFFLRLIWHGVFDNTEFDSLIHYVKKLEEDKRKLQKNEELSIEGAYKLSNEEFDRRVGNIKQAILDGQFTIQDFITYSCLIGDSIRLANGICDFGNHRAYIDFAIEHIDKTISKSERSYKDERLMTMLRYEFRPIGEDFITKVAKAFSKVKSKSLEKLDKQILKQLSSPNKIGELKDIDISTALYKLSKNDLFAAISAIKNDNQSLQILLNIIKKSSHNTKVKEYQNKMQDLFMLLSKDAEVGSVSRMILSELASQFMLKIEPNNEQNENDTT